ncbi:MAG: DNA-3-methyladenine glycosylase [Rhizobiaceae bacterium]
MAIRTLDDIRTGLEALQECDPRLVPVIATAGDVPLRLSTPDFAGLASIIVSQQVSKASADAIFGRLSSLINPLTAQMLAEADDELLRAAGLSRPKQRTLRSIAQAVLEGEVDLQALCHLPADEAITRMVRIKGIGPWTAEIYLLFCAGHADIFPAGDLALQEAVRVAHQLEERPSDKMLREIATSWSPWRGVAARLLWAYYSELKGGREILPA